MEYAKQAIQAENIVKEPDMLDNYSGYVIILDYSGMGSFKNMTEALNILYLRRWRVVNISYADSAIFALLERSTQ